MRLVLARRLLFTDDPSSESKAEDFLVLILDDQTGIPADLFASLGLYSLVRLRGCAVRETPSSAGSQ